jgi:gliding motility-associated-like protein
MKWHLPAFIFSFIVSSLLVIGASAQGLRINEFSQGSSGAKEYIELVVVGQRTCTDSCADIREWIVDDNNGWLGAGSGQGIATGCLRFANDPNWSCVPYGSIILLYNDGDMNTSITQAPDPTDANNDNVYIVPASSIYIERNGSSPVSPSSVTYVYPSTGFIAGGGWSSMGMANTGDAVIVTSPADLTQAYHSFGYGGISGSGNADIYIATSGGQTNYYLTDDQYNNAASWIVGSAPGNETPGAPNTTANGTWINGMLTQIGGGITNDIYACIIQGGSYFFNNQNLTATGIYNDTFLTVSGCDSIIELHLQVFNPVPQQQTVYGCNSVTYQSIVYTSSTTITDTLQSYLGCDSAVNVTHIIVQSITPTVLNDDLDGCGSVVFNGNTYTASTVVTDTILSIAGCDSVYANINIQVHPQNPVSGTHTVTGCGSVQFNGQIYTANAVVNDTVHSTHGCDSVYRLVTITILETGGNIIVTPEDTAICQGKSVKLVAKGGTNIEWYQLTDKDSVVVTPDSSTTYAAIGISNDGCKDTAFSHVIVENLEVILTASGTELVEGDMLYLNTTANFPYNVTGWYPQALFWDQHAYAQTHRADVKRTYAVFAESTAAGCKDTAKVLVLVNEDEEPLLPNAFAPEGDGINDYIYPHSNKEFTIQEFIIFNRWGNQVYEWKQGDTRGWDGTYKGVPAEQGVFVYHLKVSYNAYKDRIGERNGNITLLR